MRYCFCNRSLPDYHQLNWDNKQDLDQDFVELNNGYTIVLQPIDKRFGAIDYAPYVLHSGDDRHGNSEEGEFLHAGIEFEAYQKNGVLYDDLFRCI